jgi:hypothetical protein
VSELEGFQCRTCGKWHDGVPLDYSLDAPDYWTPALDSEPNSFRNSDFCVIRKENCFVRGWIEIPIVGESQTLQYGVWVSLSENNFQRMVDLWNDPSIISEPPYFGWLSNSISLYPETLNLKTNVKSRNMGTRPYIELEPTDHPLAVEQRKGIMWSRVREIAEKTMHP